MTISIMPLSRSGLIRRIQSGLAKLDRFPQRRIHVLPFQRQPDAAGATREMLFLAKPELCGRGVDLPNVLDLALTGLEQRGYQITGVSLIPAAYIAEHHVAEKHYGAIARIYTRGTQALSAEGRAAFNAAFGLPVEKANVLGGGQIVEQGLLSGRELSDLWLDPAVPKNVKLAPGTYAARRKIGNNDVFILNGFAWGLLQRFVSPGNKVIALGIASQSGNSANWHKMRNVFLGATDPTKAAPGSLRRQLLDYRAELGLGTIDGSCNGGHLSAGPLEGLAELKNWFGLPFARTAFGNELLRRGLSLSAISWLLSNPTVPSVSVKPLFDLTECQEPGAVAGLAMLAVAARREAL